MREKVFSIDPPRKGCEPALIERIGQISPRRVVYVSCNPDTLARDVALFARQGYALRELTPADLFPRTGHVECVGWLERMKYEQKARIALVCDPRGGFGRGYSAFGAAGDSGFGSACSSVAGAGVSVPLEFFPVSISSMVS